MTVLNNAGEQRKFCIFDQQKWKISKIKTLFLFFADFRGGGTSPPPPPPLNPPLVSNIKHNEKENAVEICHLNFLIERVAICRRPIA